MSIPVICDRCRSTGVSGEADFSHLGDLLEFTPVPRKKERVDGWSPEKQRAFIAALSATGSKRRAALAIGMQPYGADQLLKAEGSDSFKAAVERAMAIAAQNGTMKIAQGVADAAARSAVLAQSRSTSALTPPSRLRGHLPPEGEDELARRGEETRERITERLLNCRRLYLQEIAYSPGKRAALEILTELPIDWEKAKALEPQPDEPWRRPNMREPDFLLMAENGWHGGMAHGPDKMAELRKMIDEHRASEGLPPVEWEA